MGGTRVSRARAKHIYMFNPHMRGQTRKTHIALSSRRRRLGRERARLLPQRNNVSLFTGLPQFEHGAAQAILCAHQCTGLQTPPRRLACLLCGDVKLSCLLSAAVVAWQEVDYLAWNMLLYMRDRGRKVREEYVRGKGWVCLCVCASDFCLWFEAKWVRRVGKYYFACQPKRLCSIRWALNRIE